MDKVIAFMTPENTLTIVMPCISMDDPPGFSEDDAIARAMATIVPQDAIDPIVVDTSTLPEDWVFRDAWKHNGKKIEEDLEKSKEIWKKLLVKQTLPLLAKLDVAYQRADEIPDPVLKQEAKLEVIEKKQELRNVVLLPEIASAQTIEELKAVWPEVLGEK